MSDSEEDPAEEEVEEEEEEGGGDDDEGVDAGDAPSKKRSFVDDEAEGEDDDDESEEEEDRPQKKKKRKGAEFIDDIAEVEDDDDDDDEDDEGDDLINDEEDEVPDENDVRQLHARVTNIQRNEADNQQTAEELEKFIQERYANRQEEVDVDEWDHSEVEQQGLLPTVRDPKLWMVRCRPGRERETVICLMQKYINKAAEGEPMLIKSALFQDKLKGYVYIEADKESHVMAAVQGSSTLFVGRGAALVPIREMVDVVTVVAKSAVQLAPGAWVRVRGGTYKKDLAKVVDVDQDQITIQLLPRVDIAALVAKEEGAERKKSKYRPPAKAFSSQEVHEAGVPVERRRDAHGNYFDVLPNGHRFQNGYHIKTCSIKSIQVEGVTPTFDELQKFNQAKGDDEDAQEGGAAGDLKALSQALGAAGGATGKSVSFVKGDMVKVVRGDLKDLKGRVVRVEGAEISLMPDHKDLHEELKIPSEDVEKYFEVGAHVKVTEGEHRDETGLVVRVEESVCVLFTDTTKAEIKVFSKDLVECAEVSSGLESFYGFEIHDLVALDQTTVGMIVRVEREAVQVMTNRGAPDRPEIRTCRRADLKRKIFSRNARTTDQNMQQVGQDAIVEITTGPCKGRRGTVKHVSRGQLFILSREELQHGGIMCVRARNCRASGAGGPARPGAAGGARGPAYGLQSPAHHSQAMASPRRDMAMAPPGFNRPMGSAAGGAMGGHRAARRDEGLVGTRVKVKKGPYKGYKGTVVDATDTTCRLELEDPPRTVTVKRDQIDGGTTAPATPLASPFVQQDPTRTPFRGDEGGRTPMHHWGAQTPLRDDPSRTPLHDPSRTPLHESAWNPNSRTPVHQPSYLDEPGPSAPTAPYGGGYNAPTPGGYAYTPGDAPTPGDGMRGGYEAPTPTGGYPGAPTPGSAATPGGDRYSAMSPYATPGTYGAGATPFTPGGAAAGTPGTPGGGLDAAGGGGGGGGDGGDEVRPFEKLLVETRGGEAGVITSVQGGGRVKVALLGAPGSAVDASMSELTLVRPGKKDQIIVVKGDFAGQVGTLIGVDGADGIVKMGDTLDIHILDLSFFGKLQDAKGVDG